MYRNFVLIVMTMTWIVAVAVVAASPPSSLIVEVLLQKFLSINASDAVAGKLQTFGQMDQQGDRVIFWKQFATFVHFYFRWKHWRETLHLSK